MKDKHGIYKYLLWLPYYRRYIIREAAKYSTTNKAARVCAAEYFIKMGYIRNDYEYFLFLNGGEE